MKDIIVTINNKKVVLNKYHCLSENFACSILFTDRPVIGLSISINLRETPLLGKLFGIVSLDDFR